MCRAGHDKQGMPHHRLGKEPFHMDKETTEAYKPVMSHNQAG